ncbi:TetR/AcrR family transcriptional regulator [Sphingomonas cavernae]|uniref:TetR/AcrR family transcriptional regulator n=1 Tax=Sphingomonas cavernae TaxID=2320861 RepID=A0A418WMG8_9SPHN|nr:TetR/AcrR family transcriptional regulator [Sphingomonas cavernae]RJF91185.1 TetR/AcrR family transcriptional regulator [Sphingomonas cavernae]
MSADAGEAKGEVKAKAARGQPRASAPAKAVSHNLNGQRLGRKGRDTRERILAATNELLAGPADVQISLSAVARNASLGMTSLYLYFNDLTELLLAVLDPVMATAEDAYISLLRTRWNEDELGARAQEFVKAYHTFWVKNSRILHLRNSMADHNDQRMMFHRVRSAQPVMLLLVEQMDGDLSKQGSPVFSMATALMTGLERVVTVTTDANLPTLLQSPIAFRGNLLEAESRLIELGIRDYRALAGKPVA